MFSDVETVMERHQASWHGNGFAQAGAPVPGFGSMFSAFDFGVATSALAWYINVYNYTIFQIQL